MCGHVGIAGKLELKDEKTMKRLLLMDFFRGPDSTGMAFRNKTTGATEVLKLASHPLDFFEMKRLTPLLSAYTMDVFLGHNRLATKGKVNGLNAHPFHCGHIIGAHNGTLENASWKELEALIGEETEVDSKAIFLAIERHGIEETMKHMYGAWALVWIDTKENTLNFLRNDKRPLSYAYDKERSKILWASEYEMIEAAVRMSDTKYELYTTSEGYSYFDFEVDKHYTYSLDVLSDTTVKAKNKKPKVKELKGKEVPKTPVANFTPASTTAPRGNNGFQTRITLTGTATDPFAGVIALDRFRELAKYGCSYCDGPISYADKGVAVYIDSEQILCNSCNGKNTDTRIFAAPDDFEFLKKALM